MFGRPGESPPGSVSIIAVTAITPFDFNKGGVLRIVRTDDH